MSVAKIQKISNEEYENLQLNGYHLHSEKKMRLYCAAGNYVTLRRDLGMCERVARSIGCIIIAPLACITAICFINQVEKCVICSAEAVDGYEKIVGFVKDDEATSALHKKDYAKLGIDSSNLKMGLKAFLQNEASQGRYPIQSQEFPQHFFFCFYGPVSKFSYIILIPNNDFDKLVLFPVCNKDGKSCNSNELKDKAYKLCAGYREGVKKITDYMETVPIAHATTNSPYGPINTTFYENKMVIVST